MSTWRWQAALATSTPSARYGAALTLDRLSDYLDSGGTSLKGFAEHVGLTAVAWPSAPIDPFFNVNTSDELDRAEAIVRGQE